MIKLHLHLNKISPQKFRGFTLIEIAVSLFILTMVIGALLTPLTTQTDERQAAEAERVMLEIREALIGYALNQTSPRLPCPDRTSGGAGSANDKANDGVEDFNSATGACQQDEGNIPWATLGVNSTDPWGNRYRYLTTPAFTNRSPATALMSLSSISTLKICTRAPIDANCTVVDPVTLTSIPNSYVADNVPAVIISHGRNGYGAMNGSSNIQIPTSGASSHELENSGGTYPLSMVSKTRANASGEEFDDIVIFLSPNVLFSRLVAANKLP